MESRLINLIVLLLLEIDLATGKQDVVAFTKGRISNIHLAYGDIMTYDKDFTNINAQFTSDGKFLCEIPGLYAFHMYAVTENNEHVLLDLYRNDQLISSIYASTPGDFADAGNSVFVKLDADDVVYVKSPDQYPSVYNNNFFGAPDQVYTTFTGFLLAGAHEQNTEAFSVGLSHEVSLSPQQHVLFDRIITTESQAKYDPSTGIFTASFSGIYIFHYHTLASASQEQWLDLYYNDQYINSAYGNTPNEYADAGNSVILHLNAGDKMSVRSRKAGGIYGENKTNSTYTTFSGSLLAPKITDLETNQMEEIAFSVGASSRHTHFQGHVVLFDRAFINHGSGFDTKTGKFTAKYSGIYVFHFHALSQPTMALRVDLYRNFLYINSIYGHVPHSGQATGSNSVTLELLQGDEVFLDIRDHRTALSGALNEIYCTFSGYLLAPQPQYHPIIG